MVRRQSAGHHGLGEWSAGGGQKDIKQKDLGVPESLVAFLLLSTGLPVLNLGAELAAAEGRGFGLLELVLYITLLVLGPVGTYST